MGICKIEFQSLVSRFARVQTFAWEFVCPDSSGVAGHGKMPVVLVTKCSDPFLASTSNSAVCWVYILILVFLFVGWQSVLCRRSWIYGIWRSSLHSWISPSSCKQHQQCCSALDSFLSRSCCSLYDKVFPVAASNVYGRGYARIWRSSRQPNQHFFLYLTPPLLHRSIDRSINQSINQSINRSFSHEAPP